MTVPSTVRLSLVAIMSLGASCGPGERSAPAPVPSRRSVVLVAVDGLAARRLALYEGPVAAPSLERLAARGVLFVDAATEVPQVRPALASLLTGQPATAHGVHGDIADRLDGRLATLATVTKAAGATTAAFVSSPFAAFSSGFARGFDLFDAPETIAVGPGAYVPPVVPASNVAEHFATWVGMQSARSSIFAFIELADLQGVATRGSPAQALQDYDQQLGAVDAAIGKLVAALDAAPIGANVEIFVVGTHGVMLGEGGARGDAFWLGPHTLRVPLVWAGPSSRQAGVAGSRSIRRVTLRDVSATAAAIFGTNLPEIEDAESLGGSVAPERTRYAWTWAADDQLAWAPLTAVDRGKGWRAFAMSVDGSLYAADGSEASTEDRAAAARQPATFRMRSLSAVDARRLTALGLRIGTGGAALGSEGPRDPNAWLAALGSFRHLAAAGNDVDAMNATQSLLAAAPDSYAALLARLFMTTVVPSSNDGPALRAKLLARYANRQEALHWSAHSEMVAKNYEAAAALLDAAIAAGPVEPEIYYDQACVAALRGKSAEAIAGLRHAVEAGFREWAWMDRDPDLASIRSDRGYAEILRTHGR